METPLFGLEEIPYESYNQRSIQIQQLIRTQRIESIGLRASKSLEQANDLLENSFFDLMERTQSDFNAYLERSADIEFALDNTNNLLEVGFEHIDQTLDRGFGEIASFLNEVSQEVNEMHVDINEGFTRLGAVFSWGLSHLIMQAELENEQLSRITKILLKPVTTEAQELFYQSKKKYRQGFMDEALESLLYLLQEKKYRVVLNTFFPIYILIADIYLFEKGDFEEALKYYESALKYLPSKLKKIKALLQLSIAHCHYLIGNLAGAKQFAQYSKLTKRSNEASYHYARYCSLAKEVDEAMVTLKYVVDDDIRYVFRILNEPDFIGIKKQILILLIKVRRINLLWKLGKELKSILPRIDIEKAKNSKMSLSNDSLDALAQSAGDCVGKIDAKLDDWDDNNDSGLILSSDPEIIELILTARRLIKESALLFEMSESIRRHTSDSIKQEKENKERELASKKRLAAKKESKLKEISSRITEITYDLVTIDKKIVECKRGMRSVVSSNPIIQTLYRLFIYNEMENQKWREQFHVYCSKKSQLDSEKLKLEQEQRLLLGPDWEKRLEDSINA